MVALCPLYLPGLAGYAHLLQSVDSKRSEDLYKRILAIDPDYTSALANYAALLVVAKQDYSLAEKMLKRALQLDPRDVEGNS